MKRIILPSVRMFVKVLRNYMYFMMHGMLSPDYPVDNEEEFHFGNMWSAKGWKENALEHPSHSIKKCCAS